MHADAGWRRTDEGHTRLKQGNVRQEAWRQRGRIVRKELQRRKIDYKQHGERFKYREKQKMSRSKEMSETTVETDVLSVCFHE